MSEVSEDFKCGSCKYLKKRERSGYYDGIGVTTDESECFVEPVPIPRHRWDIACKYYIIRN